MKYWYGQYGLSTLNSLTLVKVVFPLFTAVRLW